MTSVTITERNDD